METYQPHGFAVSLDKLPGKKRLGELRELINLAAIAVR
jgi:hypothetical protein